MVLGMDNLPSVDLPRLGASPRDLTPLLKSNDTPLPSDIPFIRDIVSREENRLDALNDQIQNLQAKLAQLTRMRDETAESVRQHRSVLHPVRCVPPEILCEIFALVLLSADEDSMARATAPWRLGLICRSWRQAALSYPLLWCSITPHSFPASDPLVMMDTQLLRSSNAPLVVSWQGDQPVDFRLLPLVVVHCDRWRTLRLSSPFASFHSMLDWLLPATGRLAQLETLEMIIRLHKVDIFSTAPALRQLVLTDREFQMTSPQIDIPWGQITHYRARYELWHQLSKILKRASALVECAVKITERPPLHGQNMILLPHLQRLDIDGSTILNHLEAPSLHTLSSRHTPGPLLGEHLPFIQRSGCSLTRLVLTGCEVSFELITLLQGLPALAYLRLECPIHPPHWSSPEPQATLFDALTLTGTSEICPNLTSFLYGYYPDTESKDPEFFGSSFSRMVQSRSIEVHAEIPQDPMSTRPSPLQFLRVFELVESRVPPPADLVTSLETLRDGGIDAAFLNHSDSENLRVQHNFFI
ncbi:hypothetical protein DFH08DRAFT_790288 [Mycena albidolilacea]|uniref:F-box domain-containing protein n=1 Tax=Mycena albidolilacea TaxID=1033008 RepID=A0AAD6ZCD7_9AGAR|nr:hypothetical protein DFH08DRAFT_790288 [Mycena albidolilacea]